jgi:DUF4097 and DUF4098 domain-containing protein YvlB
MNEERKMILQMVADGKISSKEAVELLNAIKNESGASQQEADTSGYSNFKESIEREVKASLSEAKIAGKEALKTVKESVQKALEENKAAIKQNGQTKTDQNIEKVAQIDENLAKEYRLAEEEFESAKASFKSVEVLKQTMDQVEEEITELNKKEDLSEEELVTLKDLKSKLIEISGKKDRLNQEAKQMSASAQEKMLEVRRKIKEKGIDLDDIKVHRDSETLDIGEVISKATSQIGPLVNQILDSFNIGGGEGHVVVESFNWTPQDSNENVVINTNLQNGSVRLYNDGSRDQIYVKLNKKIKAEEENVKEIADNLVKVKQAGNIISIEVEKQFSNRHSVSAEIYLPDKYKYDCNLKSVNGSIKLDAVNGDAFLISTTNGRIVISDGYANHIQAGSTNGSIKCSAKAKEVKLNASNGSIKHYINEVEKTNVDLSTINGSVKAYVTVEQCTAVNAKSSVGSVKVVDGEWNIIEEKKSRIGNSLIAVQKGCEFDTAPIKINAKTTHGSIKVIQE